MTKSGKKSLPLYSNSLDEFNEKEETEFNAGVINPSFVSSQPNLTSHNLDPIIRNVTPTSRPHRCKPCINIKVFTLLVSILACINGGIAASYLPAVITTIEKRFQLDSSLSGLIVASYEIGATVATIFVSYLGHHRHIPIILGIGTLIVGIGSGLFSLPHFVAPPYSNMFLAGDGLTNITSQNDSLGSYCSLGGQQTKADTTREGFSKETQIALFIVAQTVIGIGSAPILTLGISYVDTHVGKKASSQYLAFIYAASVLGAVVGFGLGSVMLELYIDVFRFSAKIFSITSNHPHWLGAWWLGFLMFGLAMCLFGPVFFAFPKSLKAKQDSMGDVSKHADAATISDMSSTTDTVTTEQTDKPLGHSIKELPRCLCILLRNPLYMLINIGGVCEMIIVTGFLTFVPKYIETQFDVKESRASLLTGCLAIPGAVLGIVLMGFLLKRFKMRTKGAMHMTLVLNLVALCCFILAFFLGCNNHKIAGLVTGYDGMSEPAMNLTAGCNSQCACSDSNYHPVCYQGVTYFSACHAGCIKTVNSVNRTEMLSCSCLSDGPESPWVTGISFGGSGACEKDCMMMIPYCILLLISSFSLAATKTPLTMVTLWSVEKDLKSFGLGIQVVIFRLLALLPAPILYGAIIDNTCLWWRYADGYRQNCILYDIKEFRYRFAGVSTGFHIAAILALVACTLVVRKNPKKYDQHAEDEEDVNNQNSLSNDADNIQPKKLDEDDSLHSLDTENRVSHMTQL